jgi:hypothetical protein
MGVGSERAHRRINRFGGRERLAAEIGQFPATRDTRQDPPADRLFERGDAARDGGVVRPSSSAAVL